MADDWDWVDQEDTRQKEERSKDYFNIEEGSQQFVLLTHIAPLPQVWDNATKKYRPAVEGDKNVSMRGVCWVLQDGLVKQAKLPYTIVKQVRALSQNPDWEFKFPFLHTLTLKAEGAGTKEVKYSLTPSPKKVEIAAEILEELKKKPTPEEMVEKIKEGKVSRGSAPAHSAPAETSAPDYPEEDIDPADIPF